MRATAQDPDAARLMGINVNTTISMTFLLGGMLAGAAGLMNLLYQTSVWYFQGFTAGLIAFTAAVMGGIGNLKGAVLGGPDHRLHPADLRQPHRRRVDDRRRLRLPRADHGLPAAGPHRRGRRGKPDERRRRPTRREQELRPRGAVPRLRRDPAAVLRPAVEHHRQLHHRRRVRRHGAGPEHRRRLRRPARPRLRRVLRDRRVHDGVVRLRPLLLGQRREGHPRRRPATSPATCPAST